MTRGRSLAGIALCFLIGYGSAAAQTQTGEIFGKVTDGTGAILPGVTVTISGTALLQPQAAVTADSGAYRFPNLPIGIYTVRFELTGFQRIVHEEVRIQAGFNAEVNARLELSTVQETVTVTGESPVVDTKSSALGTNFGKELLDAIPSARDPWVILEQTPGMVMDRAERRRQPVGAAVVVCRARQHVESAVEHGRRNDYRHGGGLVADLLRLRLVRGDPDHHRRRRRVAGSQRRCDQLRHQEWQQQHARLGANRRRQQELPVVEHA